VKFCWEKEGKTYQKVRNKKKVGAEDFQKHQWLLSHRTEARKGSAEIYLYFQLILHSSKIF
jgi:hypothetical protein